MGNCMSEYTVGKLAKEKLELDTKFGRLVCWMVRDDEDYKEFAIDLVTHDGREYQVATIGTNEGSDDPHFNDDMIHAYIWDGQHEEEPRQLYMDPHGDGYYYDAREEA